MKKMLKSVVLVLSFAVLPAQATVIHQALVTTWQKDVYLCDIDDSGTWSVNKPLIKKSDGKVDQLTHAIYKNGIVYACDMKASKSAEGYIHKYTLAGARVGEKIAVPGCIEALAITPDGKTIFACEFEGKDSVGGRIFKVDVKTEAVTEFCHLSATTTPRFRDLEIDEAGHLFVADRTGKFHVFNYDAAEGADVPTTASFTFCEGAAWNPADNLVYVTGNDKTWGVFYPDGRVHTALQTAKTSTGWSMRGAVIGGSAYFAACNAVNGIVKLSPADNDFTKVFAIDDTVWHSGVSRVVYSGDAWSLDEAATESMCANGTLADYPILLGGGARLGATGVKKSCVYFSRDTSRLSVDNSEKMIPAKDDFALFFWIGLPARENASGVRHLFSNAMGSSGDFAVIADANGIVNTLGLVFTPVGASSAVTISSEQTVADGMWHQVGVLRRGTALELWLDGTCAGTATVAATDAIAQDRIWYFGAANHETTGFLGAGSFIDDIQLFLSDIPPPAVVHSSYVLPTATPAEPERPAAEPLPVEMGSEIAHVFAGDGTIGMPMILKDAQGTLWVTLECGNGAYDAGRSTTVYKSMDGGASWSVGGALAGASVSLFEQDGALCAIGLKTGLAYPASVRTCAVWTADGSGVWTEAASCVAADGQECRLLPSPVVKTEGTVMKAVAVKDNGTWRNAYLTFPVSGTVFSQGALTLRTNRGMISTATDAYSTAAEFLGGNLIPVGSDYLAIHPVVDRHAASPKVPFGPERVAYQNIASAGTFGKFHYDQFRGGAKPFNVIVDPRSGRGYAVTVPSTKMEQLAEADPSDVTGTLAVYASPDVSRGAWYPCGILAETTEGAFLAPSFAIDGDDLVIACAVSAADGCGSRGRTSANYLSFLRVRDFRTACAPKLPEDKSRAFLADRDNGFVLQYYRMADGEWQPGGVFVDASDLSVKWSGYSLANPGLVRVARKHVFLATMETRPARIFEFDLDGNLVNGFIEKTESVVVRGMDISADGSYALVASSGSAPAVNAVYRVDLRDRSAPWTQLVVADGSVLATPYDVAIVKGGPQVGDFFVSNNTTADPKTVVRYRGDGTFVASLPSVSDRMTYLAVPDDAASVYMGSLRGNVWKTALSDYSSVKIREDLSGDIFLYSNVMSFRGGKLLVTARGGWTWCYDPVTGLASAPFAALDTNYGVDIYDRPVKGLMLIFR